MVSDVPSSSYQFHLFYFRTWRTTTATKTRMKIHEWLRSSTIWFSKRSRDGAARARIRQAITHQKIRHALTVQPLTQSRPISQQLSRHPVVIEVSLKWLRNSLIILCDFAEHHRRGESSQRHKFRNRIAYLIATKRKTLKRLALKRVTRTPARRLKSKYVPRQTKRAAMRAMGRKPYDKKMRRLSVQVSWMFKWGRQVFWLHFNLQSKYKKPVSHEQTSDSEVPQKIKKRRTQSYTATSSYRSFRRKAKTPLSSASNTSTRVADKSDSSSDYDDDDDGFGDPRNGNRPSTSSGPVLDVNVPSTSTGITSNGKGFLFRIANAANDSDDDQSIPDTNHPPADNLLRVLRSPPIHNNNHHRPHYEGVNDGAGTSSQRSFLTSSSLRHQNEVPPNGRKKHQTQEDDSSFVEDYASTNSNSLMSSTEESSNDSFPDFYASKRRKLDNGNDGADENGNDSANNNSSSFNNNNSFNTVNNNYTNGAGTFSNGFFGTPKVKLTPDSGLGGPTPSPSSSRSSTSNCNQQDVLKKIEIIKRNYRKNIQTSDDDSD